MNTVLISGSGGPGTSTSTGTTSDETTTTTTTTNEINLAAATEAAAVAAVQAAGTSMGDEASHQLMNNNDPFQSGHHDPNDTSFNESIGTDSTNASAVVGNSTDAVAAAAAAAVAALIDPSPIPTTTTIDDSCDAVVEVQVPVEMTTESVTTTTVTDPVSETLMLSDNAGAGDLGYNNDPTMQMSVNVPIPMIPPMSLQVQQQHHTTTSMSTGSQQQTIIPEQVGTQVASYLSVVNSASQNPIVVSVQNTNHSRINTTSTNTNTGGNTELANLCLQYELDDSELRTKHQHSYENAIYEKALSTGNGSTMGGNEKTSKQLTFDEWNRRVYLLRFWDGGDGILSQQQFRKKYVVGYKIRSLGFRVLHRTEFEQLHPGMLIDKVYYSNLPTTNSTSSTLSDPSPPNYDDNENYCIVKTNPSASSSTEGKNQYLLAIHQLETFEAIRRVHIRLNHSRITPTLNVIKGLYWNITEEQIKFFCTTCPVCHGKGIPSSATSAMTKKDIHAATSTSSLVPTITSPVLTGSTTTITRNKSTDTSATNDGADDTNGAGKKLITRGVKKEHVLDVAETTPADASIINLVTSMQQQQTEMMNTIQMMLLKLQKIETDVDALKHQQPNVDDNDEYEHEIENVIKRNDTDDEDEEEMDDGEEEEEYNDDDDDDKPLVPGNNTRTPRIASTMTKNKNTKQVASSIAKQTRSSMSSTIRSLKTNNILPSKRTSAVPAKERDGAAGQKHTTKTKVSTKRKLSSEDSNDGQGDGGGDNGNTINTSTFAPGSQRTKKSMITSRAASGPVSVSEIKEEHPNEQEEYDELMSDRIDVLGV